MRPRLTDMSRGALVHDLPGCWRRTEALMAQTRTILVGVLVLAIAGCAATPPAPTMPPPGVDVRGRWIGKWSFENPDMGGGDVVIELQQFGADAAGNATVTDRSGTRSTYFEGNVTGNTLVLKPPYASGTFAVDGDEMRGIVQGIMPAPVTLRCQR